MPPEPSSRPWPQDPMLAAAAVAASMAVAGASLPRQAQAQAGQPTSGAPPLGGSTHYGMQFSLPTANGYSMYPSADAPAPAQPAAAQPSANAPVPPAGGLAPSPAAYGLRHSVRSAAVGGDQSGGRDSSGVCLAPLRDGSGSDDAGGASGGAMGCGGVLSDAAQRARREAALKKFKEKRANRCFIKKIRYTSRKQLAEARPRNRGQFVRVVKTEEPGQEEGAALLALAEGVTVQA